MSYEELIYHICRSDEWVAATVKKIYKGSSQDQADGFIHFSTRTQIIGSAAKHRAQQDNLILLEVDPAALGPLLKWEPARDGNKFPHLYGDLPTHLIRRSCCLNLGPDGLHVFPKDWGID